ncbi:MAG: serine/threonine protein kinase [Lentisphaeraceae bacterium]|nr:serine/threonine protein kinase [Lentisphaeraceae bacterium]
MSVEVGDTIAERYLLKEKTGEDEFGFRFLGEDNENQNPVMVKIMAPRMHTDEQAKARFLREIELLSKIRHQSIVSVLEAGEEDGTYYIVSEFEEGINLSTYLENQGRVDEKEAIHLIMPAVEALKYTWDNQQLVHRDLKPSKIFITDDNLVKLFDLGLAKSTDDTMELTGAGFTVGTPDYMSPEQASGEELDFRSDMYSLGIILYQIVVGAKPFEGTGMEVLNMQLTEMPVPANEANSRVSSRCATLIDKMIQKSRDERFQSWSELIDAMHLLLDTTVMESDLQIFDVNELTVADDMGDGDDEPSFESLTSDDDGAFGSPGINASGIIMEEDVADNAYDIDEERPAVDEIEPGTIIGNGFEIDRKIGDGSMGEIYLAFSEEHDSLVQIKILPAHMTDDTEKVERFLQEIKITSSLAHPNLLSVIEAGEDNGRYYLVTQYEEGISYHDYIGRYGPLHEKDALKFLIQIAEVLNYAWKEKKLLHREVKPENILIKEDSKEAKLTDFGVAKPMSDEALNLTGMGFTIGTPDYMSPEQVRGDEDLDSRSDMYALGLVLYESLAKRKTFESDNVMALMNKQMVEAHKPITKVNPKVSSHCSDLVDRLLCKNRDGRFESWDELIRVFRKVADGEAVPALKEKVEKKSQTAYPAQQTAASPGSAESNQSKAKTDPPVSRPATKAPAPVQDEKKGNNNLMIVGAVVVAVIIVALAIAFR